MDPKQFSAGGVIIGPDKQIVLVNNRGLTWTLPKGHLQDGETEEDCAKRELYEETGLTDVQFEKLLGVYDRKVRHGPLQGEVKRITMFLARTDEHKLEPIDEHNPEARWVTVDEALTIMTHKEDREFLESVRHEIE